jgi:hypothetical protein
VWKKNTCIVLFFPSWVLDSRLKFAFGCLGAIFLGKKYKKTFLRILRDILVRIWIRILLFSSVTFKMATEIIFFCLLLFEVTFTSFFIDKKSLRSHKTVESRFFFLVLLDDGKLRSRIRTSHLWIRIREVQKHTDPAPDLDPHHCQE